MSLAHASGEGYQPHDSPADMLSPAFARLEAYRLQLTKLLQLPDDLPGHTPLQHVSGNVITLYNLIELCSQGTCVTCLQQGTCVTCRLHGTCATCQQQGTCNTCMQQGQRSSPMCGRCMALHGHTPPITIWTDPNFHATTHGTAPHAAHAAHATTHAPHAAHAAYAAPHVSPAALGSQGSRGASHGPSHGASHGASRGASHASHEEVWKAALDHITISQGMATAAELADYPVCAGIMAAAQAAVASSHLRHEAEGHTPTHLNNVYGHTLTLCDVMELVSRGCCLNCHRPATQCTASSVAGASGPSSVQCLPLRPAQGGYVPGAWRSLLLAPLPPQPPPQPQQQQQSQQQHPEPQPPPLQPQQPQPELHLQIQEQDHPEPQQQQQLALVARPETAKSMEVVVVAGASGGMVAASAEPSVVMAEPPELPGVMVAAPAPAPDPASSPCHRSPSTHSHTTSSSSHTRSHSPSLSTHQHQSAAAGPSANPNPNPNLTLARHQQRVPDGWVLLDQQQQLSMQAVFENTKDEDLTAEDVRRLRADPRATKLWAAMLQTPNTTDGRWLVVELVWSRGTLSMDNVYFKASIMPGQSPNNRRWFKADQACARNSFTIEVANKPTSWAKKGMAIFFRLNWDGQLRLLRDIRGPAAQQSQLAPPAPSPLRRRLTAPGPAAATPAAKRQRLVASSSRQDGAAASGSVGQQRLQDTSWGHSTSSESDDESDDRDSDYDPDADSY